MIRGDNLNHRKFGVCLAVAIVVVGAILALGVFSYQASTRATSQRKNSGSSSRYETPPSEWHSPPNVSIGQGFGVESADYIVFKGSAGNIYAKSGENGQIVSESSSFEPVIESVDGNAKIYITTGVYDLSDTWNVDDGTTVETAGSNNVKLNWTGDNTSTMVSVKNANGVSLKGMELDMNMYGSGSHDEPLKVQYSENIKIEDINAHHSYKGDPIGIRDSKNVSVKDIRVASCLVGHGFAIDNSKNVTARDVSGDNIGGKELVIIEEFNGGMSHNIVIDGVRWGNTWNENVTMVWVGDARNVSVNNVVGSLEGIGNATPAIKLGVAGHKAWGVSVSDVHLENLNTRTGIKCSSVEGFQISNFTAWDNVGYGIWILSGAKDGVINNVVVKNGSPSINAKGIDSSGSDIEMNNIHVENIGYLGVRAPDSSVTNVTVRGASYGIWPGDNSRYSSVKLENCTKSGARIDNVENVTISNVWAENNERSLYLLNGSKDIKVTDLKAMDEANNTEIEGTVSDVEFIDSEFDTTELKLGGCQDIKFVNNKIHALVKVQLGANGIVFTNNEFLSGGNAYLMWEYDNVWFANNENLTIDTYQTTRENCRYTGNKGYGKDSGKATLLSGNTSVTVSIGINGLTPEGEDISVTPVGSLGSASYYFIENITSSSFDIGVDADPTQDVDFAWSVEEDEGA